jgi:3D (Asp-Asp-Asp) domain-containing protein
MVDLVMAAVLVGNLQITSYRSLENQTDQSPWITSIGERVNNHGVAVSQDLLRDGRLKYGDIIFIEGFGFKVVNDCMNPRLKNAVDIWVATKQEEHRVGVRNLKVWKVTWQIKEGSAGTKAPRTGRGTQTHPVNTLQKIFGLTPMSSQTKIALTPGTNWLKRMKRTSTLTTVP